ncbi:MAG: ABC transporter permease [Acidobacteriota bacterium]
MLWILRRLGHGLLLLVGVSCLTFGLTELAPGDYFDDLRLDPRIPPETVAAMQARYGLDQPLVTRYVRWLGSVARGELGYSFAYDSPVAPLLWPRARNSLLLAGTATLLAWLIAVPLGLWAAASRWRWVQPAFAGATSVLLAIPELLLALLGLWLAARTGWLPTGGMASLDADQLGFWARLGDLVVHLVLPATVLTLGMIPVLARHVHASVTEVLPERYLQVARRRGVGKRRLLLRHALPVAANPLITLLGASLGSLLSVSLLVEVVLSWPGLGPLLLGAILARDVHLVIGAVLLSTLFLLLGNLLADLLLYASDPRIRVRRRAA